MSFLKNHLKKVFIGSFFLVVLSVLYLFSEIQKQPEYFRVQKSISIKAPIETVYALVSTEEHFSQWNPWPNTTNKIRASVTNRVPYQRVDLVLEFGESSSFKVNSDFTFIPQTDATVVVWGTNARNASWQEKLAFRTKNKTAKVDHDLEIGLERIKEAAESMYQTAKLAPPRAAVIQAPLKKEVKIAKAIKKAALKKQVR